MYYMLKKHGTDGAAHKSVARDDTVRDQRPCGGRARECHVLDAVHTHLPLQVTIISNGFKLIYRSFHIQVTIISNGF